MNSAKITVNKKHKQIVNNKIAINAHHMIKQARMYTLHTHFKSTERKTESEDESVGVLWKKIYLYIYCILSFHFSHIFPTRWWFAFIYC